MSLPAVSPVGLLTLRDHELQLLLSYVDSVQALGRVACVCGRLRGLLERDGGHTAWRSCRAALAAADWRAEPCVAGAVRSPHDAVARAVAISGACALFPDGETSCVVVRSPGADAPLSLRDAAAAAQAQPGEVLFGVHEEAADPKRGVLAIASRAGSAAARGARSTKLRTATLSGRSRRTLRVPGQLTAIAVGPRHIACARLGSGAVQIWDGETGRLVAEVAAHSGPAVTIGALLLSSSLLVSGATGGRVAIHSVKGAVSAPSTPVASHGAAPPAPGSANRPMLPAALPASPAAAAPKLETAAEEGATDAAVGEGDAGPVAGGAMVACLLRVGASDAGDSVGGQAAFAATSISSNSSDAYTFTGCVTCLDLAGNWLLAGADDGTARLWLVGSGRVLRTLHCGQGKRLLLFRRDGQQDIYVCVSVNVFNIVLCMHMFIYKQNHSPSCFSVL